MVRIGKQSPRHRFILNPYSGERFASCPECHLPTEERKFPLLIHVDPRNPVCLNKTCRYCPHCDLVIAHQDEVEEQLAALFGERQPELVGNAYLVLGTLDPEVWERGRHTPLTIPEMMDNLHDWQDVLSIRPAGQGRPPPQGQRPKASGRQPGRSRRRRSASAVPGHKPGRNDPCWCGSGQKYKDCHLRRDAD
jgi:hypothetical protein